jgi:hypothetical protein
MFRKLLSRHPLVHVPRETHFLPLLHDRYDSRAAPAAELFDFLEQVFMAKGETVLQRIFRNQEIDAEEFRANVLRPFGGGATPCNIREFMNSFYEALGQDRGVSIVGDKTPDYGLCMGVIQSIWPHAKFIHIARDGRDVAISMSKVLSFRILAASGIDAWWQLALHRGYEQWLGPARGEIPLERFFELWRRRLTRTRGEAARLSPGTFLEIRYEELLRTPAQALAQVHAYLGLPEPASWIDRAAEAVDRDNLGRNRDRPEYQALTSRFARELADGGFAP